MFKKKANESSQDDKGTKKITTKTVEQTGGVQTTTTTITCAKADFDTAFKKLNLDPKKFQSGGTTVTRQIIYTNSSGEKEVLEETVETYEQDEPSEPAKGSGLAQKFGFGKSKMAAAPGGEVKATPGGEVKKYKAGEFEKECLKKHNEYRSKHGVPKLTLSDEICSYAKEWADHLASKDLFEHRSGGKYGENIFMKWSSDPNHMVTGEEAVDSWYSEIKDYTFGQEPRTLKSGHFTQVVWKASQEMGVAWARSKSGKLLVVANYSPAGNFVGKFTENVPPLKK
ncbi:hypothetical protein JTE90_002172 [Oedothorax gibbosus]|uniref:SCP domain-containing protein n=1 Tax=Oedothorax gibbosus TaxID=931172 RepID=A0AAV6V7B3_9ARAC|nr:hypothetical protein JTE90_002172 [Oedothorax gibbosus]